MTITDLQSSTRSIAIEFPAGTLNVSYYPARLSRSHVAKYNQLGEEIQAKIEGKIPLTPEEEEASAGFLAELIAGWDLLMEDGTVAPITPSFLTDQLGWVYYGEILAAILKAANPNA